LNQAGGRSGQHLALSAFTRARALTAITGEPVRCVRHHVLTILEKATAAGVNLQVDGDLLRFESDRASVPEPLGSELAAHKDELLALLRLQREAR
jgi:TubC N-terminal docking domain